MMRIKTPKELTKMVTIREEGKQENVSKEEMDHLLLEDLELLGDFNAYVDPSQKSCGGAPNRLYDNGFKGLLFTLNGGGVKEHIDKVVCSSRWSQTFQDASFLHLLSLKSNHKRSFSSGSLYELDKSSATILEEFLCVEQELILKPLHKNKKILAKLEDINA
ncbi:hypothetical protein CR513_59171, partial [Mucuna pruriens]